LEVSNYAVEEPDDDEEPDASGEPTTFDHETSMISLHAIAGIHTEDTMHLYITVGNEQFVALLDSKSTHNFIRSHVARHVGLQL
jgi:hypothetical protein